MKIVILAAGAAGRYCGTCLHDNTLAAAISRAGEDVLLVPTYTPLRTDEENVSQSRLFFGGINVYLQQKSRLFRHTPWFIDALLDSPALVDWLSRRSSSIEAEQLGALTVSTLQGEAGNQRKELDKLVHWLSAEVRPQVVHLSNALLIGCARELRERLKVPVVCALSGEDIFVEQLAEPHYSQVRRLLKERARDVEAFTALNHYFADYMADYLEVDRGKIHVIRHGLNLEGHGKRRRRTASGEVIIGYFARIAPEKGLHHLIEAFALLGADPALPKLRLHTAGYMSDGDQPYFDTIRTRVESAGLRDRFEHVGELDRVGKIAFLQSLDLMSLPTVYRESKGLSALEAMANAVPLVLPAHGAFPELIEDTGGGLLHEPENPASLAAALKQLILDPALADELGRRGQQAIQQHYTASEMARQTLELYRSLISGRAAMQAVPG